MSTYHIQIAKNDKIFIKIDAFEIEPQKITFLFGESGIGKSILSKAVYGLLDPALLDVQVNKQNYREYLEQPETIAIKQQGFFVFQEPSTHLNPLQRLKAQINEGSLKDAPGEQDILRHLWDTDKNSDIQEILDVFPKPYRPSGGEKQRILLAMAFKKLNRLQKANAEKALFVFDEPSGSLDNHFRNRFLALLLEKFRKQPFSSIIITHDYSIISELNQQHSDLEAQIVFKELARQNQALIMRDFAAKAYLKWIQQEQSAAFLHRKNEKPLLQIESGYQIFDKKMAFEQQKTGKENKAKTKTPPTDNRKPSTVKEIAIHPGEMVYIKAASGVGKTTLAKIIMGLQSCKNLKMQVANYKFTDKSPKSAWRKYLWAKKIGMVFQHADEALNLNSTVREVFYGLPSKTPISDEFIRKKLGELFDFKIDAAFLDKKVAFLSGGQKQRLNLLRTLILDTDLIIMDEPLNGLDFFTIQKVLAALQQKQKEGKGIFMISHNEDIFDAIIPKESIYYLRPEK